MTCLPVLCLGLISLNDCNPNAVNGSGVARTETRTVTAFSKIDLVGSPDVDVTVGPETSVSVTTDDNILPLIETTVSGDTLKIDSKGSFNTRIGPTVKITAPSLDGVTISGSGNISVTGLKGEVLEAHITGSGNITLTGDVDRLSAKITG